MSDGLELTLTHLHPPERLLHSFSLPLTHLIPRMPRGSLVHRAPAVGRVLRHMRSDVHPPKFSYEFPRLVVLVPTQRHALSCWHTFPHQHPTIPPTSSP